MTTATEGPKSGEAQQLGSRFLYLLIVAACAIGYGNIWRFPYLVYKYGGLLFILVYIVVALVVTVPVFMLEVGLGQVLGGSQIQCWSKLGKYCKANVLGFWVSFTILHFYQLLLAWSLIYLVNSFTNDFPWANRPEWTMQCQAAPTQQACSEMAYCEWRTTTCAVDALYNSKDFSRNHLNMYNEFDGRDKTITFSRFSPWVFLGLLVTWVFAFLCVFAGPKILAITTYLTMGLPALLMIALVITTAMFKGAGLGIKDYIGRIDTKEFGYSTIVDALSQTIFSLSVGQGVLSTLSASNAKNDNFVQNGLMIFIMDTCFSILSGFAIFSMLGFLATESQIGIQDLPNSGIALAFTTYPAALAQLPNVLKIIVGALFFFMLWTLGFSTLCTLVEGLVRPIVSSPFGRKYNVKQWQATAAVCVYFAIIPAALLSTNFGFSFLDRMDTISAVAQTFFAGFQAMSIGWIYLYETGVETVGKTAQLVHTITFLASSVCLGILLNVQAIAAIIIGLGVPIIGFIVALYYVNIKEASISDKIYYLTIWNVEKIRLGLNKAIEISPSMKLPKLWSWCIKYFAPYISFALVFNRITAYGGIADPAIPWYITLISGLSPLLFVLVTLYSLYNPNFPQKLITSDIDQSVFAREMSISKKPKLEQTYHTLEGDAEQQSTLLNDCRS